MKIKKASTNGLLKKYNQIIHDKIKTYKEFHIVNEIRRRLWNKNK